MAATIPPRGAVDNEHAGKRGPMLTARMPSSRHEAGPCAHPGSDFPYRPPLSGSPFNLAETAAMNFRRIPGSQRPPEVANPNPAIVKVDMRRTDASYASGCRSPATTALPAASSMIFWAVSSGLTVEVSNHQPFADNSR